MITALWLVVLPVVWFMAGFATSQAFRRISNAREARLLAEAADSEQTVNYFLGHVFPSPDDADWKRDTFISSKRHKEIIWQYVFGPEKEIRVTEEADLYVRKVKIEHSGRVEVYYQAIKVAIEKRKLQDALATVYPLLMDSRRE